MPPRYSESQKKICPNFFFSQNYQEVLEHRKTKKKNISMTDFCYCGVDTVSINFVLAEALFNSSRFLVCLADLFVFDQRSSTLISQV